MAKAQNYSTDSGEPCKVKRCKRLSWQKGWCPMHYFRWYRSKRLGGPDKLQRHKALADGQVNDARLLARKILKDGYTLRGYVSWIARKYGVDPSHMNKALYGKTYKDTGVPGLSRDELA